MSEIKNFNREKFKERFIHEINAALRKNFSDPRLQFVTCTNVELSPDYDHAKVYWDTFNLEKRNECANAIAKIAGKMRSHLAKIIRVKKMPTLKFIYDSQFEDEKNISLLLDEAQNKNSEPS